MKGVPVKTWAALISRPSLAATKTDSISWLSSNKRLTCEDLGRLDLSAVIGGHEDGQLLLAVQQHRFHLVVSSPHLMGEKKNRFS